MVTEPSQPLGNSVRGLLFGSVAECYERYRLDYPDELVDTVLGYAGRPVCTALEVGAGTGKATRPFAARGIEVTALEPDADMAKVLARVTHGLPVRPVVTTFEHFRTESRFDLVYAAAAWHWTSPVTRWAQAVELLVPGGVLALFGAPAELKGPRPVRGGRRDRESACSQKTTRSTDIRGRPRRWPPPTACRRRTT
jgi:SAM-dependent methyltransferase